MDAPTIADIYAARKRIRPYLPPTPLRTYHGINDSSTPRLGSSTRTTSPRAPSRYVGASISSVR